MRRQYKSVIIPSAPINVQLQHQSTAASGLSTMVTKLESNRTILGHYYELFVILLETGCRISEALAIQHEDISDRGMILLRARKNGDDRVVSVSSVSSYMLQCKLKQIAPFLGHNRFTAYRILKRLGISKLKKDRSKESVTHMFRDEYVKDARTTLADDSTLSKSIGHKSKTAIEYYGKD